MLTFFEMFQQALSCLKSSMSSRLIPVLGPFTTCCYLSLLIFAKQRHWQGGACSISIQFFFLGLVQRTDNTFLLNGHPPNHGILLHAYLLTNHARTEVNGRSLISKGTVLCPVLHKPPGSSFPSRTENGPSSPWPESCPAIEITQEKTAREGLGRVWKWLSMKARTVIIQERNYMR